MRYSKCREMKRQREKPCIFRFLKTVIRLLRWRIFSILPQKEFYLLYKLLSYPNKIFTRPQLMDEIWGMFSETDERTVNTHINRLRNRFSDCKDFEIVTVRGLGYKAVKKVD